jgi:transcriptional regulator with XRE-family HTH domain
MPHKLKKYFSLGELLLDYRKHRNLTQLDFAAMLDVDVRTVIRWEKNESLIKTEKELLLIENLGIPHQVIRNLNTDRPISVYFDFQRWLFSLSLLSGVIKSAKEFKTEHELETSRFEMLSKEKDFEFISYIQQNQKNKTQLKIEVLKKSAQLLPPLNIVIRDHSGYHGGHISILPLKMETYEALRDQKMKENEIGLQHLSTFPGDEKKVFYFYSIYSNSTDNSYYLINKLLFYFKKNEIKDYIFAGITFQKLKVERFQEMGFQVVWQKEVEDHPEWTATFISGNFNEFLFSVQQV